jgi:hypothetical protein
MANIRKTFNFRNGVQVDDDNLIVNPLGLVGIGTTIPTEALDVRGTAKVVGLVTADQVYTPSLTAVSANITNLSLSQSIIGGGVSISSGIITSSGSGVVTYYGDGGRLLNLPTSQWVDTDVGLGFTSIYARGFVGVATNDPRFALQIGGNNVVASFASGVGINSVGDIVATGIVTANKFSGIGSNLTLINADNISSGTISTDRVPQLTNSNLPNNINLSGIITASGGFSGNLTGNLTGNVTGNLTGNVTGIASTARTLTGTPDILVNNVTATSIAVTSIGSTNINVSGIVTTQSLQVGSGVTSLYVSSSGKLGIGSAIPNRDIQILKTGTSSVEFTGSVQSEIILGQQRTSVLGIGDSTAVIRFGNVARAFDLINGDQGDFNYYLHTTTPVAGVQTGNFNWVYGQTNLQIMTLTYGGRLGIGKTNPDHTLHVVGTSTVTGNSYFGNNVEINGNTSISGSLSVSGSITLPSIVSGTNLYNSSGISTFYNVGVSSILTVTNRLGINTATPKNYVTLDVTNGEATFGAVGVGTTANGATLRVDGTTFTNSLAIGNTTFALSELYVLESTSLFDRSQITGINSAIILLDETSKIGVGTTSARSAVDFADAGKESLGGAYSYMLPPRLTTTQRAGLSTVAGAFIFNITTSKFQGYTGVAWTDFH